MVIDLHSLAGRIPQELRVRTLADDNLERTVAFQNQFATPSQWLSLAAERHRHATSPEPLRLTLMVEAMDDLVAVGTTSDGGLMRSPDGSWRLSIRVVPAWRSRGVGAALLETLEAHARERGSSRVVASAQAADPDGARFATAHGYRAHLPGTGAVLRSLRPRLFMKRRD